MADVVSSVTSLFSTAIEAFDLIQVARAFVDNAGIYQSKLAIIQLRLSRCGEAAGLNLLHNNEPSHDSSQNTQLPLSISADAKEIETILYNINQTLKKAKNDSARWKQTENEVDFEDEEDDLEPQFKRLKKSIRQIVTKRCSQVKTGLRSFKWALYKKEQCEALATNLLELVEQLEKIVQPEDKLDELRQNDVKTLGNNLKEVLDVVGDVDPYLKAVALAALKEDKSSVHITMTAHHNNGQMIGKNEGSTERIFLGNGYTVNYNRAG